MDTENDLTYDLWICCECAAEQVYDRHEMIKHLEAVHGIDAKTAKGTRCMIMHLDGRDWYQSNYEWEINGLKLINHVRNKRKKNDLMRWA